MATRNSDTSPAEAARSEAERPVCGWTPDESPDTAKASGALKQHPEDEYAKRTLSIGMNKKEGQPRWLPFFTSEHMVRYAGLK